MIRSALRELLRTLAALFAVSVIVFVVLDSTGEHDWWGTLEPGRTLGMPREEALVRQVPRLYVAQVRDATVLTIEDVNQLVEPARRQGARDRLVSRGAVIVPTILSRIANLSPSQKIEAFRVLAPLGPQMTGGEVPPEDTTAAAEWWNRFRVLHEIELRDAYARRHVQRLLDHESSNAESALRRMGTLALPALFEAIDEPLDRGAALRLSRMASTLTHRQHLVSEQMSAQEVQQIIEAWRAWWFAHRLEYLRLGETARTFGHVTESRYGLWLWYLGRGRLGPSKVTHVAVLRELRVRLPISTALAGLSGLLATALMVAFGGGKALRQRPVQTKLLDLTAALIPGLAAFFLLFFILCSLCTMGVPASSWMRASFGTTASASIRLVLAIVTMTLCACAWLTQGKVRVVLHAVRAEAESWARESKIPHPIQLVRHGARVGIASLLAPLALNSLLMLGLTLVIEPIFSVQGMGALTIRSVLQLDAPWLLIAALSTVPILQGRRVTRAVLLWSLGGRTTIFAKPTSTDATAETPQK